MGRIRKGSIMDIAPSINSQLPFNYTDTNGHFSIEISLMDI